MNLLSEVIKIPELIAYRLTDAGNASLIADYVKDRSRYDADMKQFWFYNGRNWTEDKESLLIQEAICAIREQQSKCLKIEDTDIRTKHVKHYIGSENYSRINAAIKILQSMPDIVVRNSIFDRNDTLFNVLNGTIDLKTKTIKKHDRNDYITRISKINYVPGAVCPVFNKFLNDIFDSNKNLIEHEQRKLGYCLSGLTSEQKLFINFGSGCNGKSTLIEVYRALMGNYCINIPIECLMSKDIPGISNDIVRLRFARLATTGEVEIGKKLAESQAKLLTGGDYITARALYSEPIEFRNKAKIMMGTNHLPGVRGQEHGMFRRFDITPFNVTIPKSKIDKNLFNKLLQELPGILNWALDGFLKWQEHGLGEYQEIIQSVENYRVSQDPIATFINECCIKGLELKAPANELYQEYKNWCQDSNEFALSQRKFGTALSERGFKKWNSTGNKVMYAGLMLKDDEAGTECDLPVGLFDNPKEAS